MFPLWAQRFAIVLFALSGMDISINLSLMSDERQVSRWSENGAASLRQEGILDFAGWRPAPALSQASWEGGICLAPKVAPVVLEFVVVVCGIIAPASIAPLSSHRKL